MANYIHISSIADNKAQIENGSTKTTDFIPADGPTKYWPDQQQEEIDHKTLSPVASLVRI